MLGEKVNIKSYNIETVIAEKLETLLTRGTARTTVLQKELILMLLAQKVYVTINVLFGNDLGSYLHDS